MKWIPGGTFVMGSDEFYPEERPAHQARVDGFWIDEHPVTNAEFARFVDATGYVTVAERRPAPADYPGVDPALLVPGSLVFRRPRGPVAPGDWRAWWAYVEGACWRHPEGPHSSIDARLDHPVVHVAHEDARAYAAWAGKSLPTEREWEFAARGGLEGRRFVWGDEFAPGGKLLANTWQGPFPWRDLALDGFAGTSPVGVFPPNGYGLYDMAGNVWEWTDDPFGPHGARPRTTDSTTSGTKPCCAPERVHSEGASVDGAPFEASRRVVKGGSHLCAPNYCLRYRPAARQGQAVDSSTVHIGFRCVRRAG